MRSWKPGVARTSLNVSRGAQDPQISRILGDSVGTYQLHIVDHFVFVTFECFNGVSVKGEGHSLQSLVLGTHADVCLHLNTPQISF